MSTRLNNYPDLPHVPGHSWLLKSKTRARLFAALVGVAVTAGTSAACWFFYQAGEPPLVIMVASNVFAGVLAALLIAGVLSHIGERTEILRSRLQVIGELNHHIRNGLQLISFSAYQSHDQGAIGALREGSDRIEWALREILESLDVPLGQRTPHPKKPPRK